MKNSRTLYLGMAVVAVILMNVIWINFFSGVDIVDYEFEQTSNAINQWAQWLAAAGTILLIGSIVGYTMYKNKMFGSRGN